MNKTQIKVSVPEMVGILKVVGTACTFISMKTATTLKPGKDISASCPFGEITHLATRTGWLNINYNEAVKRRVAKLLGCDVSKVEYTNGQSWHKHIMTDDNKMTPVVVNAKKDDGKYYAFYFHRKTKDETYIAADGKVLTKEQVAPYFYASKPSNFKPTVRTVTINNIRELKVRGMILRSGTPLSV